VHPDRISGRCFAHLGLRADWFFVKLNLVVLLILLAVLALGIDAAPRPLFTR
jgi:hypothetical protein